MGIFNKSFYTTDFDQDMLDFISSKCEVENKELGWSVTHSILAYGGGLDSFWTEDIDTPNDYSEQGYTLLTKQQFKEKIGMPKDNIIEEGTFGKKELVDGMFVKTRDGRVYIKLNNKFLHNEGYVKVVSYTDDLIIKSGIEELDIVEVFSPANDNLELNLAECFSSQVGLVSIWKRTPPKSEKVIKLEKLIMMHEEQLEATKKLLAEELSL